MFFHIRKLLNDSFEDSISEFCEPFCVDRTLNKDGSCPIVCMSECYETCYRPLFPEFSPPPPPPSVSDHHHQSKSFGLSIFLIISLALLATTFFVFFTYTVYKLYRQKQQRRQGQGQPPPPPEEEEARLDFLDENHGPVIDHPIWYIRTAGLQPSVISAITICKYKRGDGLIEGTDCSVCLNEFQEDETLRLLPKCNHAFHIPCIDTWLRSHTNCPMCRAGILKINSSTLQLPPPWQSSSNNNNNNNSSSDSVSESDSGEEEETAQVSVSGNNNIRDDMENDERVIIPIGNGNGNGFQPMRRSVSLDSLSASILSSAITADAFGVNSGRRLSEDKQDLEMNGTLNKKRVDDKDQSLSKSAGSSSMVMRSLSCSAKVFLSRYSRSTRISVVPLPRSF